ncbi:hemagglutinin-neuraminidase [Wenzhou pacific spadenose shark paramyxovirus]|uniref:Hemagglutinin-neuraminidase n=1 Tax=Wenzhou pacific spadenose shark paramyxovirus TaxID=2116452 RepID=A0A2P1GMY3_9MONO|nr:hemagglutinin-neuraminidase [Wenzhou pacific spadenose shark paramyxovirus]AVM87356.1 hemagglutinin-neuraminidase [Wenzhou pacific spadenose shark paramyxovirus]
MSINNNGRSTKINLPEDAGRATFAQSWWGFDTELLSEQLSRTVKSVKAYILTVLITIPFTILLVLGILALMILTVITLIRVDRMTEQANNMSMIIANITGDTELLGEKIEQSEAALSAALIPYMVSSYNLMSMLVGQLSDENMHNLGSLIAALVKPVILVQPAVNSSDPSITVLPLDKEPEPIKPNQIADNVVNSFTFPCSSYRTLESIHLSDVSELSILTHSDIRSGCAKPIQVCQAGNKLITLTQWTHSPCNISGPTVVLVTVGIIVGAGGHDILQIQERRNYLSTGEREIFCSLTCDGYQHYIVCSAIHKAPGGVERFEIDLYIPDPFQSYTRKPIPIVSLSYNLYIPRKLVVSPTKGVVFNSHLIVPLDIEVGHETMSDYVQCTSQCSVSYEQCKDITYFLQGRTATTAGFIQLDLTSHNSLVMILHPGMVSRVGGVLITKDKHSFYASVRNNGWDPLYLIKQFNQTYSTSGIISGTSIQMGHIKRPGIVGCYSGNSCPLSCPLSRFLPAVSLGPLNGTRSFMLIDAPGGTGLDYNFLIVTEGGFVRASAVLHLGGKDLVEMIPEVIHLHGRSMIVLSTMENLSGASIWGLEGTSHIYFWDITSLCN